MPTITWSLKVVPAIPDPERAIQAVSPPDQGGFGRINFFMVVVLTEGRSKEPVRFHKCFAGAVIGP